tara:strand:- start:5765 stop:7582 length:1818 start_codon:yes stop_codon:yes gene_type:complete
MNIKKYSPVVYEGIPELDPESVSYQEYWEEQIHRCMNGYKPKGLDKITGKHYYYLNFYKILGNSGAEMGNRKTLIAPWYRDLDKLYFDLFEQCKQEQKGMIVIKARDKGFSYMNSALCGHEYTFYPYNEVGIAAGLQVTADSFFDKVKKGLNAQHNNFKHSVLKDTSDVIKSGYRQKNKDGKWNMGGYQSAIHCRTMSNPEVFKGERLSVMVFEEAGEFKELLNAYMSSKACFMDGDIQFGVPVIGGTGGDIETSSKDFMEMYYNADSFGLIPMFIPASVCYHGFFDIKTGVSKEKEARKALIKQREKLEGRDSAKAYNLHIQNYPLTVEEAFLKTKGSRFDLSLINAQRSRIMSSRKFKNQIQRGRLEWIFDKEDGFTEAVEWIADPTGPYLVLDHPDEEYQGLDIGGIDSYDQDTAESTASMGSAIIYRRFVNTDMASDYPIAEYTERPKTAEEFWDGCLKLAIYFNSKMLIEYTKIGIIDYFKRKGALRYMKEKPKTAHAPGTLTRNRYGLQMNKQTKAVMEQYIDDYIKTNVDDIWFIDLLNELADYGTRNTDRAIAFGLCLIHNVDVHAIQAKEKNETDKKLGFVYYRKENGRLIPYKED